MCRNRFYSGLGLGIVLLTGAFCRPAAATVTSAVPVMVGSDYQYFEASSQADVVARITLAASAEGDTLQALTVVNPWFEDEPADEPADIAAGSVRLWYVAADTGALNTVTAQYLGAMTYNSGRGYPAWSYAGAPSWVGDGGALYLTVDITATPTADTVCRFQVETGDLTFASGPFAFSDPALPIQPPKLVLTPYFAVDRLDVNHSNTAQIIVSTGQTFSPMVLRLINPGTPLTAPVFVTGLTLTVRDGAGTLLAPNRALDVLGLRDADTGVLLAQIAPPAAAAPCYLALGTSVTAVDARRLEIFGTVCSDTVTAAASFRLDWNAATDLAARDAYSGAPVTVYPYLDSFPMTSNLFYVQYAAKVVAVSHVPALAVNSVVIKGQTNVNPLNLVFRNPGNTGTARVDITRLNLFVTDAAGVTLAPSAVFSRVALTSQGGAVLYGETTDIPATGSMVTLTLTNSFCSVPAYQSVTAYVQVDIRPDATAVGFKIALPNATAVRAQDSNSLLPVTAVNAYGSDPFPMYSNAIRVASSFLIQGQSLAPHTLYAGQRAALLQLTCSHPGPSDMGVLALQGLTVTARNRAGALVDLAAQVRELVLVDVAGNPIVRLAPAAGLAGTFLPLTGFTLAPYNSAPLRLEVLLADAPAETSLAIGLEGREQVSVIQPSDPTRPVFVSGAWPLYSEPASLGGGEGRLRLSNFPNPFPAGRAATEIAYYLDAPATVSVALFTLAGDQVRSFCRGALQTPGEQSFLWDGRTESGAVVVNGVYILRVEAALIGSGQSVTQLRKIAVVK